MTIWPFRYFPCEAHRCPHCQYAMLRTPRGYYCCMLTCTEGVKHNGWLRH